MLVNCGMTCIRDTQKLECLQLETTRIVFILVLNVYILKLGGQNWKTVESLGNSIYFIKLKIIWLPHTYLTICQLLLEKQ